MSSISPTNSPAPHIWLLRTSLLALIVFILYPWDASVTVQDTARRPDSPSPLLLRDGILEQYANALVVRRDQYVCKKGTPCKTNACCGSFTEGNTGECGLGKSQNTEVPCLVRLHTLTLCRTNLLRCGLRFAVRCQGRVWKICRPAWQRVSPKRLLQRVRFLWEHCKFLWCQMSEQLRRKA